MGQKPSTDPCGLSVEQPPSGERPPAGVSPLILWADEAFRRDLPQLLERAPGPMGCLPRAPAGRLRADEAATVPGVPESRTPTGRIPGPEHRAGDGGLDVRSGCNRGHRERARVTHWPCSSTVSPCILGSTTPALRRTGIGPSVSLSSPLPQGRLPPPRGGSSGSSIPASPARPSPGDTIWRTRPWTRTRSTVSPAAPWVHERGGSASASPSCRPMAREQPPSAPAVLSPAPGGHRLP